MRCVRFVRPPFVSSGAAEYRRRSRAVSRAGRDASFAGRLARRGAVLPPPRALFRRAGAHANAAERGQIAAQRAAYAQANGLPEWRWDIWKESGERRFQGGTIAGIKSQLGYLSNLGVTTL